MKRIPVSLISTVKNEEKTIGFFIDSIVLQSALPNEFIIVDGGSEDNTCQIIKRYSKKLKWLKFYFKPGFNISQGRNYAISRSKQNVIATCDAGGKYDRNWLRNLYSGFNGQVSFGIDKPLIKNKFQKNLAKVILHKNVVGSSRNMIFLKKVWSDVGGYPEDLKIGEDTLYDERIKKRGYKLSRVQNAVCYWEMRGDLESFKKQFYNYGYWDGVAYRKYGVLPLKTKLALIYIGFLYLIFYVFSKQGCLELVKIRGLKRVLYINGFFYGYLKKG